MENVKKIGYYGSEEHYDNKRHWQKKMKNLQDYHSI